MKTTNKNNKKSFRFVLTKIFVVDCYNGFNNEQEAQCWADEKISNGEFEDLSEENGINENWEILEIDENGNVI